MNTSGIKYPTKDATPNPTEDNLSKAAATSDPKSAGHVCTPQCTHDGAKGISAPAEAKGSAKMASSSAKVGNGAAYSSR